MNLSDDDVRALWRERSDALGAARGECLTETDWAQLLSGDARAQERVRMATHIASCSECADEYRLLQPMTTWVADAEEVLSPAQSAATDRWSAWRSWWASPRIMLAAAAVFLVTQGVLLSLLVENRRAKTELAGLLAENSQRLSASEASLGAVQDRLRRETEEKDQLAASQQQRAAQLTTPQLDAAVAELEPRYAGAVRGVTDPQIVTTVPDAPGVTLVLNFPPLASRATLDIEVAGADGRIRWTGRTERNQDSAALTLTLPTPGFPPGSYVIRLFDVTRARSPLATYQVAIRLSAGPPR